MDMLSRSQAYYNQYLTHQLIQVYPIRQYFTPSNIFPRMVANSLFTGVFKPLETISDVRQFICNSLEREECPFFLSAFSNVLSDDSISIAQAGLVSFSWIMKCNVFFDIRHHRLY